MNGHLNSDAVGIGLGVACMTTIFGLGIAVVATVSSYVLDWLVSEPNTAETMP
jgi:biopolymer transport protein ExbB/TolQ